MSEKAYNINSSGRFRTCSRKSLTITCGDGRINVAAVSLYLSGFPELHLSCLLDLKGQIRTWEHIEGVFFR